MAGRFLIAVAFSSLTPRCRSIHPSQDSKNRCSDAAIEKNPAGCDIVEVPQFTCATLMERHGVPLLLKIDIEGADLYCLESLHRLKERPKYVAVEVNESLDLLVDLGYTKVRVTTLLLPTPLPLPPPFLTSSRAQFKLYYGREINGCLVPSGALADTVPGVGIGGWPDQCINDVIGENGPMMGTSNGWSTAAELRSYEFFDKAPPASPHPYDLVAWRE